MKLQFKIGSLLQVFFICAGLITMSIGIGYRYFVEMPREEAVIISLYNKDLLSLRNTFIQYLENIENYNYDYAVWNNTYEYMDNRNNDFIENNFSNETFVNLEIDGVLILNNEFKVIHSQGLNYRTLKPIIFDFSPQQKRFQHYKIFEKQQSKLDSISGLFKHRQQIFMYVATPINNTQGNARNIGYLMFLRIFDQAVIDDIASVTQLDLNLLPYSDAYKDSLSIRNASEAFSSEQQRQRLIVNYLNEPLAVMNITHTNKMLNKIITNDMILLMLCLFIVMFILYWISLKNLVRPLTKVSNDIKQMAGINRLEKLDDNSAVLEFNDMAKQFNALVDIINEQKQSLHALSLTDSLTQIPNRLAFENNFTKQWAHLQRNNTQFAIVMCDIDYFKKFNDSLGHLAGDEALITVANTLAISARRANDICARYGGEEFILLFSGINKSGLEFKLNEILTTIEELNIAHPQSDVAHHITVSLGAVLLVPPADVKQSVVMKDAIAIADKALYQAKHNGRNQAKLISETKI